MYLIHESTIKNPDGVIDITIHVIKNKTRKKYDYHLTSEWAAQQFFHFYRKGYKFHGKAITILNRFKIKEEKNGNRN